MSNKKSAMFVMQPANGGSLSYSPNELVEGLANLREFVIKVMAVELLPESTVTAKELASNLMPLDYLISDVEFRELKGRSGQ